MIMIVFMIRTQLVTNRFLLFLFIFNKDQIQGSTSQKTGGTATKNISFF